MEIAMFRNTFMLWNCNVHEEIKELVWQICEISPCPMYNTAMTVV